MNLDELPERTRCYVMARLAEGAVRANKYKNHKFIHAIELVKKYGKGELVPQEYLDAAFYACLNLSKVKHGTRNHFLHIMCAGCISFILSLDYEDVLCPMRGLKYLEKRGHSSHIDQALKEILTPLEYVLYCN